MWELEYRYISNLSGRLKPFDDSAVLKSKNCHIQKASTNMFLSTSTLCLLSNLQIELWLWGMTVEASGMGNKVSLYAYKLYEAAETKTLFMKNALISKVQEWYAKVAQQHSKCLVFMLSRTQYFPLCRMKFKMGICLLLHSTRIGNN